MTRRTLDDSRFMELFEMAAQLPLERRRSRLVDACDGDAALAQEMMERVARHEEMGNFLLQPLLAQADPAVRFAAGQLVSDGFLIVREVGEGGMGVVYEALDTKLDRRCAIKCPKPGFAQRLPAEARIALSITHDNICRAYGIYTAESTDGPVDVLAMEYVDGETLSDRLARTGPIDQIVAREIARQLCAGLSAAHREGLLHRDLKSNNIMLTSSSDGRLRAVITDFGLAGRTVGHLAKQVSGASDLAGTLSYMAPELLSGMRASRSSDLYSLGVVLYELVTGRLPARHEPRGPRITPPSRLVTGLDRRWDRALRRCLAENPAERASDVADIVTILDRVGTKRRIWAALLLTATISVITLMRAGDPNPAPIRVALLPFETTAGDEELAAIGGGVLHDLSDRLRRHGRGGGSLLVIPLSEALKYKVVHPDRARATLGATHVLSGGMTRRDGKISISAAVIDARTLVTARSMSAEYPLAEVGHMPVALAGTLTSALRLTPDRIDNTITPAAYTSFAQGMFHLRAGPSHADLAIGHLQRAAQVDPRSALPQAALAEAFASKYQGTGDRSWLDRARQALDTAEARHPDLVAVHLASGRLHRVLGLHDKAGDDYHRVIQLEPDNVVAWVGLARAYEAARTRTSDAAAAYQKAVDLQPDYYWPQLEFGNFYYFLGNYERAEHHLQRAIAIAPDLVAPYTNLGGLYADLGRFTEAELMLRRSLELEESSAALTNLGAVLNYLGRDRDALDVYRRALAIGQPNFVLMVNIGDSCRRLGLVAEARVAYRNGLDLADREVLNDPGNGYSRAFVAYLLVRLGQPREARREIEQALRSAPEDGKVLRWAVLTFEGLGDRVRVLVLLQKAPAAVVQELSRQPDLTGLAQDVSFQELLRAARAG